MRCVSFQQGEPLPSSVLLFSHRKRGTILQFGQSSIQVIRFFHEVCGENPLHRKVSTEANDDVSKACTVGPTESVKQYVCSGG